jgi:hypothetical protein
MHHTKRDPRYYQNRRRTAAVPDQIREKTNFRAEPLIEGVEGHNFRFGRKFRWMRGSRIDLP